MKYEGTFSGKREPLLPFRKLLPFMVGVLFGLAMRFLFGVGGQGDGGPLGSFEVMNNSFVLLVPFAIGALTVYMAERAKRQSWRYYVVAPMASNTLFVVGTLLLLIEGWICAIVIVPLFCLIGALGGLVMGIVCRVTKWPRQTVGAFALLPLIMAPIEAQVPVPDRYLHVERSIHIEAPPEVVWRAINHAEDIRPEEVEAWAHRIGVPKPLSGIATISEGKLIRRMELGKNIRFDQICADWRENVYMRCAYDFKKENFPPGSLDDHVMVGGKYFDIKDTAYTLTPIAGGTELKISMHYRISTSFNWYTVPMTKLLFTNLEENILEFYRMRSERLTGASIGEILTAPQPRPRTQPGVA